MLKSVASAFFTRIRVKKFKERFFMTCIEDGFFYGFRSYLETKSNRFKTYFNGKYHLTYRLIWEKYKGKIPKGMQINHKCGNSRCLNLSHLYIGTQKDNMNDRILHGKTNKGKKFPSKTKHYYKLNPQIYQEIRNKYFIEKGYTQRFLAKEYQVSQVLISKILNNKIPRET